MARKPRIEYPGAFFHIVVRGNNRQDIFHDDQDRQDYLRRLAIYLGEGNITLYGFCLMTNHIHLLLERGETSLSQVLQRLHTWYARYYNLKYERVGHVFQGRYKAVLCDKDAYLLELVRYIHMNPVRASLTTHPRDYPWSSHRAYIGFDTYPFLNTHLVLSQFGDNVSRARELYEGFVVSKPSEGSREDLYKLTDQRVLGNREFVAKTMEMETPKKTQPSPRRVSFELSTLQRATETELDMDRDSMLELKRPAVLARRIFCYIAREFGRFKSKDVAAYLGLDMATVTQGVRHITQALRETDDIQNKLDRILSKMEQPTFQERISVLRDFFEREKRAICLAYLFGSAARDRMGPISDVDIAVLYEGGVDWDRHFEIGHQILQRLGLERVDLIALNTVPVELAYTCIDEGVLLYAENRTVRVEFETKVLNLYGDLVPLLQKQKLEILEIRNERAIGRYHKAFREAERMLKETRAPSREEERGF